MEAPAIVDLSYRLTPLSVRHASLELAWSVLAVLEDWTTPRYSEVAGSPLETKRFVVRVRGPPPGRPSEDGEFLMIVRRYGDRDGWWISPEAKAPATLRQEAAAVGVAALAVRATPICLLVAEVVVGVGLQLFDGPGVVVHRAGVALRRRVVKDAQDERCDHVNRCQDSQVNQDATRLGGRHRRNGRYGFGPRRPAHYVSPSMSC